MKNGVKTTPETLMKGVMKMDNKTAGELTREQKDEMDEIGLYEISEVLDNAKRQIESSKALLEAYLRDGNYDSSVAVSALEHLRTGLDLFKDISDVIEPVVIESINRAINGEEADAGEGIRPRVITVRTTKEDVKPRTITVVTTEGASSVKEANGDTESETVSVTVKGDSYVG